MGIDLTINPSISGAPTQIMDDDGNIAALFIAQDLTNVTAIRSRGQFVFGVDDGTGGTGEWIQNSSNGTGQNFGLAFFVNSSQQMTLTNTGNLGIGTATPPSTLTVAGDALITTSLQVQGSLKAGGVTASSLSLSSGLSANSAFIAETLAVAGDISTNGAVSSGGDVSGGSLTIIGNALMSSNVQMSGLNAAQSDVIDVVADNNGNLFLQTSSARFKEDIADLAVDVQKVLSLRPVSFRYTASGAPGIGYLAEELERVGLPGLVTHDSAGQPYSVNYKLLPVYLLEILKEQANAIRELQLQIAAVQSGA